MGIHDHDDLFWPRPNEEYCVFLPAGCYENYQPNQQVMNSFLKQQQQQLPPRELYPPPAPPQPREQLLMQDDSAFISSINIDYKKLVSFLEVDTSFLTLWNWNPDDYDENTSELNHGAKKVMKFEAGSLFSVEFPTQKNEISVVGN